MFAVPRPLGVDDHVSLSPVVPTQRQYTKDLPVLYLALVASMEPASQASQDRSRSPRD